MGNNKKSERKYYFTYPFLFPILHFLSSSFFFVISAVSSFFSSSSFFFFLSRSKPRSTRARTPSTSQPSQAPQRLSNPPISVNLEAPSQALHQHRSPSTHKTDLRQPITSTPSTPISIKTDLHQHRSPSTHHRSPSTLISIKTDLHQHQSTSTHHRSPSTSIHITDPNHLSNP